MPSKSLFRLTLVWLLAAICHAQLPEYYKTISRVTWVVENIDKVRPVWEKLGLTGVEEFINIELTGEFRGKPVTIYTWQITGRLGNLTVDMIQPAEGHRDAFNNFLSKHGDGIFSIVHEVPSRLELEKEIQRMKGKGVAVLQQVRSSRGHLPSYTYFDTEPQGKFVLGLALSPRRTPVPSPPPALSHVGFAVWNAAAVTSYWEKLGFPPFRMQPVAPREDSRYKSQPLSLAYEAGYQRHTQLPYEWIVAPPNPANVFADFLSKHQREGIHHIAIAADNLPTSIATFEKLGYHVQQTGPQNAFLDTDSAGGVRIEVVGTAPL